jgi:hypothetical protein
MCIAGGWVVRNSSELASCAWLGQQNTERHRGLYQVSCTTKNLASSMPSVGFDLGVAASQDCCGSRCTVALFLWHCCFKYQTFVVSDVIHNNGFGGLAETR